jgi:adenylate cyclase
MKKSLLLFIIIFLSTNNNVSAQKSGQERIDSLLSILPTSPEDTNKVQLLISISRSFYKINAEQSFDYANRALQLAEKIKSKSSISSCCFYLGNKYLRIDNYAEALKYLNTSLTIEKEGGDKEGIASVMTNISNVYSAQSNYPKALEYIFDALKLFEQNGNKYGQANCLSNIANLYIQQSDFTNAIKYYNQALTLYESIKNDNGIALILGNIGDIYLQKKDYNKGLEYCLKSLDKYIKLNEPEGIERNKSNIGAIFLQLHNYKGALENYYEALNIAASNQIYDGMGYNYSGISATYLSMANDSSYDQSFIPAGENKNSLLKKAKAYSDSAVLILQEIGDVNALASATEVLSKALYELGDYKEAYKTYSTFKLLNDSIYNMENNKKLTQTGMQYEFDKKEAAAKAEQEKKDIREKNIRNSIAGGLAGALVFLTVVYRQRNKIAKEKKRSEELLLNILPAEVAEELKSKGSAEAKQIDEVTVLFTDFKGFTQLSEKLTPKELVAEIHECFSAFDNIMKKYGVEKIKTIGDSYMAAGGLPVPNQSHANDVVSAALEIQNFMHNHKTKKEAEGKLFFEIRIGVHTGPVIAGIVGVKKYSYDIWGDTVNTASRMESSGEVGKVNISYNTYELVKDKFNCKSRGKIEAKNKGMIEMYFVERREIPLDGVEIL